MSINDVTQIMSSMPESVSDLENDTILNFYTDDDSTLKMKFYYYDNKQDYEISVLFNDSLRVKLVVTHDITD